MMMVWTETADGQVPAPDGMTTVGPVRRRSWRSRSADRRYLDLTAYLGVDQFGVVVVCWECVVSDSGVTQETMSSGTKLYSGMPVRARLDEVMATLSPVQVGRYAIWGELLAASRWPEGMGVE